MTKKPTYEQLGKRVSLLKRQLSLQKEAEEASRETEERFRLAFENANCGMALVGLDGRYMKVNNMLCGMIGYGREELEGMHVKDTAHPEDLNASGDFMQRALDGELTSATFEERHLGKQAHVVWTRTAISLVRDSQGKPLYFVSQLQDISDRKRSEKKIREKRRLNQVLLDALPCVALLVRPNGEVVMSNEAGRSAGAVPGKQCFATWGQREEPCPWCLGPKALETGEAQHLEVEAGGRIWDGNWVPIGGDLYLRYAFDITEKRLMEDRLQQAQRMESLGALADAIANNFNNLLMGIGGSASLVLLNKDCGHPDHERLRNIERLVQKGAELTEGLFRFARGEKYEVRPTDLNALVKGTSEMFGRTKKEVTIHTKYQEEIWGVEVDQGQIEQVLLNLFVNAADAMPGGGNLYLETENTTLDAHHVKPYHLEPGNYVEISVADTGMGMDRSTQQKIFEPFFTTKEKGRGTGLGLAAAYGIIKNHRGIINVYSEKGAGTTFSIYLPATEATGISEKAEGEKEGEISRGSETVLLVDDEEMVMNVGEQILEELGYHIYKARSGREAVDVYEKNKDDIDLVVLDMIMPKMGGRDTYDRLKEIRPNVKVLISSGYRLDGQAKEMLERGCHGFIQKPFDIGDLSLKMREILDAGNLELLL